MPVHDYTYESPIHINLERQIGYCQQLWAQAVYFNFAPGVIADIALKVITPQDMMPKFGVFESDDNPVVADEAPGFIDNPTRSVRVDNAYDGINRDTATFVKIRYVWSFMEGFPVQPNGVAGGVWNNVFGRIGNSPQIYTDQACVTLNHFAISGTMANLQLAKNNNSGNASAPGVTNDLLFESLEGDVVVGAQVILREIPAQAQRSRGQLALLHHVGWFAFGVRPVPELNVNPAPEHDTSLHLGTERTPNLPDFG